MQIDPDHWRFSGLALAMVRDTDTGEIRWPVVVAGLLTAGIAGAVTAVISVSSEVAGIKARQQIVFGRLDVIESSNHPATAKRYTSDDAARDLELIRMRIRDGREECRRDNDDVKQRVQRLEDRVRK